MKALRLEKIGQLNVCECDTPKLSEGELLIKVRAAGICGSDIPRSYVGGAHVMPLILGHEFSGEVVQAYDDRYKDMVGNRVGVFPLIPCKACIPCSNNAYEMCQSYNYLGSRCNGGFAEYVAVPVWNTINLPDKVTYEQAAMLEPMAVAVHAMRQIYKDENTQRQIESDKIMVSGMGTIGLLLVSFLLDAGANPNNIYAICNKESQENLVYEMGIPKQNVCNTSKADVYSQLIKQLPDLGVNTYFECIGINVSILWGIDSVVPGGEICIVGNPASDMELPKDIYWKLLRKQIKLHGTWNSSFTRNENDDWHYAIDRLLSGKLHPEKFITHSFSLSDIVSGFELMRDKSEPYVKVMCRMDI